MDTTTYDETRLKRDDDWAKYLKEGTDVNLLLWQGRVISVDPPMTVELEVTDTEPNVKGNTVSGARPAACNPPGQPPAIQNRGKVRVSTSGRIKVEGTTVSGARPAALISREVLQRAFKSLLILHCRSPARPAASHRWPGSATAGRRAAQPALRAACVGTANPKDKLHVHSTGHVISDRQTSS